MFWADITKYIRSVLFKKELESGNFKVNQAVESDNGTNISEFFENSKNHINEMVAAIRYMGITEQNGSASSSSVLEFSGYPAIILFNVDTEKYGDFEILSHSGFSGTPTLTIGADRIEVFGYAEVAGKKCLATIRYTIKISDFD